MLDSYGKMNMVDQANNDARRRSRKRLAIIALSAVALLVIIAVIAVLAVRGRSTPDSNEDNSSSQSASIKAVCATTVYPDSCYTTLSQATNGSEFNLSKIFQLSVQIAMGEVALASKRLEELRASGSLDPRVVAAMDSCKELLDLSYSRLNDTSGAGLGTSQLVEDFRTWLSAALTYQDTCLEGFNNATVDVRSQVAGFLQNSTEFSSTSLAILTKFASFFSGFSNRRRLLGTSSSSSYDGFPSWLSAKDRKLLQEADPRASASIVVGEDGTGKFTTIKAALAAVPKYSTSRTVIYVKKGVYNEKVVVDKTMWNIMMIGDGIDATVITGRLNFVDGSTTYNSATFAVIGQGFIGMSFTVKNTAGPSKHQAVALMSASDKSVFYNCSFDAFQDTLYTLSLRQFYRGCNIIGTVDFIFGNAATVIQNCNILPRLPMQGQRDTLTAQGKTDPNQNTGISIHACNINAFDSLTGVQVYLGRPWKPYSTTVYMESVLSGIINPSGWLAWTGTSAPSTIFYAEYMNTGPGSNTANRVKWKGLRTLSPAQAAGFTVGSFIGGGSWIPATGVPFTAGL